MKCRLEDLIPVHNTYFIPDLFELSLPAQILIHDRTRRPLLNLFLCIYLSYRPVVMLCYILQLQKEASGRKREGERYRKAGQILGGRGRVKGGDEESVDSVLALPFLLLFFIFSLSL